VKLNCHSPIDGELVVGGAGQGNPGDGGVAVGGVGGSQGHLASNSSLGAGGRHPDGELAGIQQILLAHVPDHGRRVGLGQGLEGKAQDPVKWLTTEKLSQLVGITNGLILDSDSGKLW
jgi:hypothetical protein